MRKGLADLHELLHTQLRQGPSDCSVPKSLPILFFGDLFTARAVTIGLNPSDREYLDAYGAELKGDDRRFKTLTSLCVRTGRL